MKVTLDEAEDGTPRISLEAETPDENAMISLIQKEPNLKIAFVTNDSEGA
jgi:hypothetical protein